jgi:phosphoribosyl 1,2-cyclic phosphate phosphodiesterase
MFQNKLTFLGTGTSVGVPMIGCNCVVCLSENELDKRLRSSAYVQYQGKKILIDIGPDFRYQALKYGLTELDAILLTHPHRDHIGGFDDIRALNFMHEKSFHLFANSFTWESLKKQFYYAFMATDYTSNPSVNYVEIDSIPFQIDEINIIPIQVMHGNMPCLGFRFGNLAYITDASYISDSELDKLKNLDILVINALRKTTHPSHFTLDQTLEIIKILQPKKAFLTHLSHHMGLHSEIQNELPKNVWIGHDGLELEF